MTGKPRPIADLVAEDVGGAFTVGLAYIGDKLGLFTALAALGKASSGALAKQAGLQERYVREWLNAMVASRYVEYDAEDKAYFLTPEQNEALVQEGARTFVGGVFQFVLPSLLLTPRLIEAFRHGGGISFGDLPGEIPAALDRMHRPWFDHLLTQQWLPGVPGLVERLNRGIGVLDVGCGLGRSTLAIAGTYPKSRVSGVDPYEAGIEQARLLAEARGLTNVHFSEGSVEQLRADGDAPRAFDLVVAIDCIHDMVDPVRALRAIKDLLAPGGVFFWSEPTGSHEPLENRNPQGKIRANLSPFHCLTVSLAADGAGLGTIIGEAGARALAERAGFASFDKVNIDSPIQQFFLLTGDSEGRWV